MCDFERLTRNLELHLAKPEQRLYVEGYHAGLDRARWQVVTAAAIVALGVVMVRLFFG